VRDALREADRARVAAARPVGPPGRTRVAIVGAGITGLATAYFLERRAEEAGLAVECIVLERAPRAGGKVATEREAGFVLEAGPDSIFTAKPAALDLCRELGLGDALLPATIENRRTLVVRSRELVPLPDGLDAMVPTRFAPFAVSPLFSPLGKLRLAMEPFVRPRSGGGDESIAAFVTRRLGREALDRMAAPLLSGIHSSDPARQSLLATFPALRRAELEHGSLFAAARARRRSEGAALAGASPFATLRGGMGDLVSALLARLRATRVLVDVTVSGIDRDLRSPEHRGAGEPRAAGQPPRAAFRVRLAGGASLPADAVVLAVPARMAAVMLADAAPELARRLGALRTASTATVSLGFRERDVPHPMRGFGFVVPHRERRALSACTWTSSKFRDRAPAGTRLVRAFFGGSACEASAYADERELVAMARRELAELMGISAAPIVARAQRWPGGAPQYDVGHVERARAIDALAAAVPGLLLAGSALHGVGLSDCVDDARRCATAVANLAAAHAAAGVYPGG